MAVEFDPCFGGRKGPGNLDGSVVALGLPGECLAFKLLLGRDAAVQALAHEDREFDFSHVEPAAMLGGKVKVELIFELMRSWCGEMFIK